MLDEFGHRGGVALIDEGHKAAAEQLSAVLERIARAGGSGIVLTATPFRTDGKDPLDPFGASIEHDLIDVATYDEVLATGRTVPTRFDLATGEFEAHLGAEAVGLIESAFYGAFAGALYSVLNNYFARRAGLGATQRVIASRAA